MASFTLSQSLREYPLVVIDVVKGCCDVRYERPEWGLYFSKIREMLPRLNNFVKMHRDNGGQIIWVKPTPWTKQYLPDNINKLYSENPNATFYVEDHVDEYNEFPDAIEVEAADIVLEKNSYSAFTNPRLSELLVDNYLVSGIYSDGCVNATIIEGWSKGYFTYILSDLVEAMDSERKQNQKTQLLSYGWPLMYGHVIQSEDIYKV
jgi:nicotinamidase-related amidase